MTDDEQKRIFSKNLNRYIALSGKMQKEVAEAIGVIPTTFNTWCTGQSLPRMGKVQMLADYFKINKSDLIDDKSNISKKTEAVRINVYGSVPAGVPLEAIEDIVDWEEIPADWENGGNKYIGLKIKGDSMEPKYIEGDTVIVKLQPDCENGQDCIVYVNGYDATLKKVVKKQDCIVLQPLNASKYEPKIYDYNDEENPVNILGVVVQIRRDV